MERKKQKTLLTLTVENKITKEKEKNMVKALSSYMEQLYQTGNEPMHK